MIDIDGLQSGESIVKTGSFPQHQKSMNGNWAVRYILKMSNGEETEKVKTFFDKGEAIKWIAKNRGGRRFFV